MIDATSKIGDVTSRNGDGRVTWTPDDPMHKQIPFEQQNSASESSALVAKGTIPALQISGTESSNAMAKPIEAANLQAAKPASSHSGGLLGSLESGAMHFLSSAEKVSKEVGTGALNEVTQHPLELAEQFVAGAALAVVAGAALVGAAAVGPEVLLTVAMTEGLIGVTNIASALWKVGTHTPEWAHDAHVVSNEQNFSKDEVSAADAHLQNLGADSTLVTAKVLGALAVPLAAGAAYPFLGDAGRGAIDSIRRPQFFQDAPGDDTALGVLGRSVKSGQYEVQDVNGISVLMPKTQPTSMDIIGGAVKSGAYRADTVNGATVFMPNK